MPPLEQRHHAIVLTEKKKPEDHHVIETKLEEQNDCYKFTSRSMAECCRMENLRRRLPILQWAPTYTWEILLKDFIAGLTVGLTAIPQGIAYAVVAGLQPQYGLYSSFMGCFVYFVLGSCKDITIGPTAIMALMTHKYVESLGPDFAVLLCFLTGIIISLLGVLHLGFLVEFISMPVTVGFTSAAAITIGSSQLAGLLGLPGSSDGFVEAWLNFFENFTKLRLWDTVLGISTILILLLAKKMKDWSNGWRREGCMLWMRHTSWLLGLGRNAVVVILGTLLAFMFSLYDMTPFHLTGTVGSGLPNWELPPFSTQVGNQTLYFTDMVKELGSAVLVVPLIGILESIAIAKAFSKGKTLDATQEMLALGMCNVMGSFVRSFPTTGSFTRTAVNHASGVVTPAGGVFTGVLVLLALSFLTSTFYFIPKATLAGVIICAMLYMVEYEVVILLWRTKKLDLVPLFSTLLSCLFLGLEYGMLVGITVNLLFILYNSARPSVCLKWHPVHNDNEILVVTPTQSLVFPATDYIRELIIQECSTRESVAPVVIDGTHIHYIDSTMAKGLKLVSEDLRARGHEVIFWRWHDSPKLTMLGLDPSLARLFKSHKSLSHLLPGVEDRRSLTERQGNYEILATTDDEGVNSSQNSS